MFRRLAIVTDSTASLPPELAAALKISVVPLTVHIGERAYDENRVDPDEILEAFARDIPVSTSPPDPPAFYWAYQDAIAAGADAILSVHISEKLSATCGAARIAAEQVPVPVHVLDARSIAMSIGYVAVAAARAAADGATPREVLEVAERRRDNTSVFFYVDTLEHLRRGGRIGRAAALLGGALDIKPLLTVDDGEIAPKARVRKSSRALRRLEDIALAAAGTGPVDVAVHHVAAPDEAVALARRLRRRFRLDGDWYVNPVSWVLGVHSGPGMLGIVVSRH